ncbi:MAG: hypothetical protein MK132_27255 [Lentisphaerales bacterium]|nr:hypothetical protein [Lentisphaerales bacterium]
MKCPSFATDELGDQTYSNGGFDYSFTMAFKHIRVTKNEILWQIQTMATRS